MVQRSPVEHEKPDVPELGGMEESQPERPLPMALNNLVEIDFETTVFSERTPSEQVFDFLESKYEPGTLERKRNFELLLNVCARESRTAITCNSNDSDLIYGVPAHSLYSALVKKLTSPYATNQGGFQIIERDLAAIASSLYPYYRADAARPKQKDERQTTGHQLQERHITGKGITRPDPQKFLDDLRTADIMRRGHFDGRKLLHEEKAVIFTFDKITRVSTERTFFEDTEKYWRKGEHLPDSMYDKQLLIKFLDPSYWRNDSINHGRQRSFTRHESLIAWIVNEYHHVVGNDDS